MLDNSKPMTVTKDSAKGRTDKLLQNKLFDKNNHIPVVRSTFNFFNSNRKVVCAIDSFKMT